MNKIPSVLDSNSRNMVQRLLFSINVQHLSHRFAFKRSPVVPALAVKTPVGAAAKDIKLLICCIFMVALLHYVEKKKVAPLWELLYWIYLLGTG